MRFALLALIAALMVGCDREGYKDSTYSKPLNAEAIQSTNGLDPDARIDTHQARPPSETPGVKGSSGGSDNDIQDPDKALGTNAPPRNPSGN